MSIFPWQPSANGGLDGLSSWASLLSGIDASNAGAPSQFVGLPDEAASEPAVSLFSGLNPFSAFEAPGMTIPVSPEQTFATGASGAGSALVLSDLLDFSLSSPASHSLTACRGMPGIAANSTGSGVGPADVPTPADPSGSGLPVPGLLFSGDASTGPAPVDPPSIYFIGPSALLTTPPSPGGVFFA
jgi:hypothetical protein